MTTSAGVVHLQATRPTVVEHCAFAQLTGSSTALADLVVARGSVLEVYSLHEERAVAQAGGAKKQSAKGEGKAAASPSASLDGVVGAQLRLVSRLELNAKIDSMRALTSPLGEERDRIMLAFADAKLAIVEFEPSAHALRTVAAHSFEALATDVGCQEAGIFAPLLRVHSEAAMAAMLCYGTHLVLLPLVTMASAAAARGADLPLTASDRTAAAAAIMGPTAGLSLSPLLPLATDPHAKKVSLYAPGSILAMRAAASAAKAAKAAEKAAAATTAAATAAAMILNGGCCRLDLMGLGLQHPRDICFLEGYAEPVLAVLSEPNQTWSGRLAFLSGKRSRGGL